VARGEGMLEAKWLGNWEGAGRNEMKRHYHVIGEKDELFTF